MPSDDGLREREVPCVSPSQGSLCLLQDPPPSRPAPLHAEPPRPSLPRLWKDHTLVCHLEHQHKALNCDPSHSSTPLNSAPCPFCHCPPAAHRFQLHCHHVFCPAQGDLPAGPGPAPAVQYFSFSFKGPESCWPCRCHHVLTCAHSCTLSLGSLPPPASCSVPSAGLLRSFLLLSQQPLTHTPPCLEAPGTPCCPHCPLGPSPNPGDSRTPGLISTGCPSGSAGPGTSPDLRLSSKLTLRLDPLSRGQALCSPYPSCPRIPPALGLVSARQTEGDMGCSRPSARAPRATASRKSRR